MRKLIFLAVASYLWRIFSARAASTTAAAALRR
jgi:hypothetical protein